MVRRKLLPTFQGVGSQPAGGNVTTATCEMTPGKRYWAVILEIGDNAGTTLASGNLIGEIRVYLNSSLQRQMTGIELNGVNSLNGPDYAVNTSGVPGTAGYRTFLTIFFAEPWRKDNLEVPKMAWNVTSDLKFQIQVDVKAGLTNPILGGQFLWDPLVPNTAIGIISKWIRQSVPTVGTPLDFNTLIDKKEWIQAINFFPTSDGKFINKLSFTKDGEILQDLLNYIENQNILDIFSLSPDPSATPRFDLVFDIADPLDDALAAGGAGSLELHLEFNAAPNGNMVAIIQRAGPPAQG